MRTIYDIGPFRLDPAAGVLTRAGIPVALGPRGVAVLAALVRSPNEFVSKSSLIESVWPDVVVEEANLPVQISLIRRVLARTPGGDGWIETLARRGYRFVGPATERNSDLVHDVGGKSKKTNLPEASTSFIGRERELVEIKRLLPRTRLLTLVGVGGIGKTRLALQVAAEVLDAYRDGVWLVDLAALSEPTLVPQAMATVLGLKEQRTRSLTQTLTAHLASMRLLVVLDNAEHLLAACAQLADALLPECPQVVIQATSREVLGVAGEQIYRVPPLSIPDPERDATPERLLGHESVRLFVERARLNLPHFAVTGQNAPALASVCHRLEGIPLALELAAARLRAMSVEEVNTRLDQRFRLVTGGSRTAPRRQHTLRSLIDWSYDLLSDVEKALLCRVSIFSGGWSLEAAERVCTGEGIDDWEVLDLLTSLADKSLAVAEEGNRAPRYRLLETVREYAGEQLQANRKEAPLKGRHLAYFLTLAKEAAPQLMSTDQQIWFERLEMEHDNLRSALSWSVTSGGDAAAGLQLAGLLWRFWHVRGYQREGRRWLTTLLAAAPRASADARALALEGAGVMAWQQGDYGVAKALHGESLALRRELGDRKGIASSLNNLGLVACDQGNYQAARGLLEESLAIKRELGDQRSIPSSLNNLGLVANYQSDFAAARVLHEEALAIWRGLGDRTGMGMALNNLGQTAYNCCDYPSARALFEECLAVSRELGDQRGIASSLNNVATVACEQADFSSARTLQQQALTIRREMGDLLGVASSLDGLAHISSAAARPGPAARFWGAAERLREEIGSPLPPSDRSRHDRSVSTARVTVGDDVFDTAWREGRAMTLEQALQYALDDHDG